MQKQRRRRLQGRENPGSAENPEQA